jgi:hypothetical protein
MFEQGVQGIGHQIDIVRRSVQRYAWLMASWELVGMGIDEHDHQVGKVHHILL